MPTARSICLMAALAAVAWVLGFDARAAVLDPAERGLDIFLHVAPQAAPGTSLSVVVQALGFPSVTRTAPLGGANVEIGWEPESLEGGPIRPPPSVTATADAEGRAILAIPVPAGKPKDLELLVAVRYGGHSRTRTVKVARTAGARIDVFPSDTHVVPGGSGTAWIRVTSAGGTPLAGFPLEVSLHEGGVKRSGERLVTDQGGLVLARVAIPRISEPTWSWTLRAASADGSESSDVTLIPREETPGKPRMEASFVDGGKPVFAGDKVDFALRLRDASGHPLADQPLRYWIGVRGNQPPATEDDWKRLGTPGRSDPDGLLKGTTQAPTLLKPTGTELTLVADAHVEGHDLVDRATVAVGVPVASVHLLPEAKAIVPGVVQRMLVRIRDGRGEPVRGRFDVKADGLDERVTLDEAGEATVTWKAPLGLGGKREVGPCAGDVAAGAVVRPVDSTEAFRGQRDAHACVEVNRDLDGILRIEPPVATPGSTVKLSLLRSDPTKARISVVGQAERGAQSIGGWVEGTTEIVLPESAMPGPWTFTAATTHGTLGRLLVIPRVAPTLAAKRTGGRAVPQGTVEVEARLTDGHGKGLPGTVSALVIDAFGGGRIGIQELDTRLALCREADVPANRCDALIDRDPALLATVGPRLRDAFVRALLPRNNPNTGAKKELESAFAAVVRSLEGAVFEATASPERLIDARRKVNGRWDFNPELFGLVTDAMDTPPLTPGGEPFILDDLVAMDSQVSFDVVARRVTRLKLFRVLAAVRGLALSPDEPAWGNPNAVLRKLVHDARLEEQSLLDPWGGTLQFVRADGKPMPFVDVRGFALHSPGPNGVLGDGDDVKDPFERVVRSGSPYAQAVGEDGVVDAKWDMVVAEETVRNWQSILEAATGTALGNVGGLGGLGEGGGGGSGFGFGKGNGTIGHGRGSGGFATGDAVWIAPMRTGPDGTVKLQIPLGDATTTWRIALVGVPDGLGPAATLLDVASDLPLSAQVNSGGLWTAGDDVETEVTVRNRTPKAVRATITASAEGVLVLSRSGGVVDLPANAARSLRLRGRAVRDGQARMTVTTRAPGLPDDVLRHAWDVSPAGDLRVLTRTRVVTGEEELRLALDQGYRTARTPRLVLTRGQDDAIAAALDAIAPENQTSTAALLDALDAAQRIERWATAHRGHEALAEKASLTASRAKGRYLAYAALDVTAKRPPAFAMRQRASMLTKSDAKNAGQVEPAPKDTCPPDDEDALEAEPPPSEEVLPCWGAHVVLVTGRLGSSPDAERVAHGVLALADRPHRLAAAATLAAHLRRIVGVTADGELRSGLAERSARSTVYAALLRSAKLGASLPANGLVAHLAPLRDATGGYGSASATLSVVRALVVRDADGDARPSRVRVGARNVELGSNATVVIDLADDALGVTVDVAGPPVVARFERPVLRSWSRPPFENASAIAIDIAWPTDARAGKTGVVKLDLRHGLTGSKEIDARIPLPPGVRLAEATAGLGELQGVLVVRRTVQEGATESVAIPVRFMLAGSMMVPEATATITRAPSGEATAPARALHVE